MHGVILKKGKEKILLQKHHWIFSGAIDSFPENYIDGTLVPILDFRKNLLGYGFFNRNASLCGRVVSFQEGDPLIHLQRVMKHAVSWREKYFQGTKTNAYRVINGEGDGLPGLIVDKYGSYLVMQVGTLGMVKLKPLLTKWLENSLSFHGIYEKSLSPSLREEKLEPYEGSLIGTMPDEIEIQEENRKYLVSPKTGQKTGFFLDQREMRTLIESLSQNKKVLNTFCYTGGFTVAALVGGAAKVDSVDISKDAMAVCEKNVRLNGIDPKDHGFYRADVFKFLKENALEYDLLILDPPAFAKKRHDLVNACRGYKEINRVAMEKMPSNSLMLTCSCSYYMTEELFQKVIFQAAMDARREVQIIGRHRLAPDHPINLYHPEIGYLKSLLIHLV